MSVWGKSCGWIVAEHPAGEATGRQSAFGEHLADRLRLLLDELLGTEHALFLVEDLHPALDDFLDDVLRLAR